MRRGTGRLQDGSEPSDLQEARQRILDACLRADSGELGLKCPPAGTRRRGGGEERTELKEIVAIVNTE
jgi:hypothetical protein